MSVKFSLQALRAKTKRNLRWFTNMSLQLVFQVEGNRIASPIIHDCGLEATFNYPFQFTADVESQLRIKLSDTDSTASVLNSLATCPLRELIGCETRTVALAFNGEAVGFVVLQCSYETVLNNQTELVIKNLEHIIDPDPFVKEVALNIHKALELGPEANLFVFNLADTILSPEELEQEQRMAQQRKNNQIKAAQQQAPGAWHLPPPPAPPVPSAQQSLGELAKQLS